MVHKSRRLKHRNVCVLLSGGIDSAACVAFYRDEGFKVSCIFVNYGQPAFSREQRAVQKLRKHFGVEARTVMLTKATRKTHGEIRGRNAFLYTLGLLEAPPNTAIVASGIHAGTPYPDCGPPFLDAMQSVFDSYTFGAVKAGAPFITWSKNQIHEFALSLGVPVQATWSCERGGRTPCRKCASCHDRATLNDE